MLYCDTDQYHHPVVVSVKHGFRLHNNPRQHDSNITLLLLTSLLIVTNIQICFTFELSLDLFPGFKTLLDSSDSDSLTLD